ncbi:MAG: hypothetical protein O4859_30650 [Trichodesmium sp. St18_bin1]|jgi:Protein of unknown function (DUF1049).|nr:hypothetical protein [Trichodesmium sp. St18_bin1]MDE5123933.1 hypothetical protein [Trichodesmium sp. St19_bin1]
MNRNRKLVLLIVLIAVIGSLALFAWQNWSPSLQLTFLGLKSRPLPISIWILGALIAGVVTYLFIYGLFELSNYLFKQNLQSPRATSQTLQHQAQSGESRDRYSQSEEISNSQSSFNLKKDSELREEDENIDDWKQETPIISNSWDSSRKEQDIEDTQKSVSQDSTEKNYEVEQEPKTESCSSSVYSYGYRSPSGSGIAQTESVYDADYRVITPQPPQDKSTPTRQKEDEEVLPKE